MRFLITGDLQAHNWRAFSHIDEKTGLNSRLLNILAVPERMGAYADEHGIAHIFFLGDIFEINDYIDVDVYDEVCDRLEKLSYDHPTYIVLGNHDVSAVKKSGRLLHPFRALKNFATVIEEPTQVANGIWCVPYHPDPQRMKSAFHFAANSPGAHAVLMTHLSVEGGRVGPKKYLLRSPIKLADLLPHKWDAVLLSDFHTKQKLAENVWYLGSPLQHSFGETHAPSFWDITVEDGHVTKTEEVYTGLPLFVREFVDAKRFAELERYAEKGIMDGKLSHNYVSVVLDDGLDEEKFRLVAYKLNFKVDFDRQRIGSGAPDITDLRFDPKGLIQRYVDKNISARPRANRLVGLGAKLYEGA